MASLSDTSGSQSSVGDTARLSLRQLNGPAIFALLIVAFALIVAIWSIWPLVIDAWRGAPKKLSSIENNQEVQTRRNEAFDGYLAQIQGRSLFHVPPPPKAPEPDKPIEVDPDKPPPPPTSYGGPAIVAMLSDTVWFAGGKKMKLGDKEDDLEIISLSPPWMGKLRWKGVDFDVNLFEKSNMLKENSPEESTPDEFPSQPQEEASEATKDDTKPTDPPSNPAPPPSTTPTPQPATEPAPESPTTEAPTSSEPTQPTPETPTSPVSPLTPGPSTPESPSKPDGPSTPPPTPSPTP